MQDQYQPDETYDAAPPTDQGDFVPVTPPESWPTVIGVLSIIFGGIGIAGGICGVISLGLVGAFGSMSSMMPEEQAAEVQAQMASSMPYPVLQGAQMLFEFALSVLLLIGGIKLLRRRRGAVGLLTSFAWLDLLSNTFAAIVGYFVFKAQMQAMQDDPNMQQVAGMQGAMAGFGAVAVFLQWVLTAIWPVFLLLWFRRGKVRALVETWE